MGKAKDLATGETRFVNTTGDSITGELLVRRARSNTAGDAALTIHPSDTSVSYGLRIDQNTNSLNFDQVNNNTTKMSIDSSGRVTKPNTPHMLAMGYKERYGTTDRHLFHTVTTNTGNHWNNTNGKFTCPVAGTYLVTAFSGYKAADNYAGIGIGYNGSVLTFGWSHPTDDLHGTQGVAIMKNASANDYFYYYANTTYTSPIASSGNEHHSHFSVYLLG